MTRLMMYFGEWFLDTTDGTKWRESVLGVNTNFTRDLEIKQRVLGTPNLREITSYSSNFNPNTRAFSVSMQILTAFGPVGLFLGNGGGRPHASTFFVLDSPQGILDVGILA